MILLIKPDKYIECNRKLCQWQLSYYGFIGCVGKHDFHIMCS